MECNPWEEGQVVAVGPQQVKVLRVDCDLGQVKAVGLLVRACPFFCPYPCPCPAAVLPQPLLLPLPATACHRPGQMKTCCSARVLALQCKVNAAAASGLSARSTRSCGGTEQEVKSRLNMHN